MGRENRSSHRKTIDYLLLHPEIFGIDKKNLFTSSSEQNLFSRGKTYGKPDIVYVLRPSSRGVVIVEYKSNGKTSLRSKGKSQIEKAVNHYRDIGIFVIGYLLEGELPMINAGNGNGHKEKKYVLTKIDPPKRVK
ncbi:MAG: hypothetical protein ABIH28_01525 [archaeon]